ncbi:uncharacterized protein At1g28695-like [Tasmannia lanceolata]|uniref:uncharacterized protein At1g28695-like n=1 Tax=Tasmannia lanceolata TaxID=3420 RepID=UPI0040640738
MNKVDYLKSRIIRLVVIAFLLSGLLYYCAWAPALQKAFAPFTRYTVSTNKATIVPKDELETALEGASMVNKTLIIAVVNKAYTEEDGMLNLFLQSFRLGEDTLFLINHLLLVAIDQISFDRCNLLQLHCYKLVTGGVDFSGEKIFMSHDFIEMMWSRTLFLSEVLRRGYNFIFTDTDVMWLRNPFVRLGQEGEDDLQISCDWFNGRPHNISNPINTGFYFVRSSNRTIALFDKWYASKNNSIGMKEQDVLANMTSKGVLRQMGLRVRILDTRYISGFCDRSRDFREVITMHANCCRSIKAKLIDLKAYLEDWKKFRGSSNTTLAVRWSNLTACINSWKEFSEKNNG